MLQCLNGCIYTFLSYHIEAPEDQPASANNLFPVQLIRMKITSRCITFMDIFIMDIIVLAEGEDVESNEWEQH